MALSSDFLQVAQSLADPGMGTENVGTLLYSIACMRRPRSVLAVGLGYSTLFLLQALADTHVEAIRDRAILDGRVDSPARRHVLCSIDDESSSPPRLVGIDDFSADDGRLGHLLRCIERLGLAPFFELHRCRYQDYSVADGSAPFELVWIDCGHQLEYADLTNRFWPLLEGDGGLLAMHYTYVDLIVPEDDANRRVVIPGPWVNAAKRQQLLAGLEAGFELISLVEPHKFRQGSVTLLRKVDPIDRCRSNSLGQEQLSLYSDAGTDLNDLNAPVAEVAGSDLMSVSDPLITRPLP